MEMYRSSGILLHPTSFSGPHGIGDLGEAAYRFVDFLVQTKQTIWQILPLGPTGYGDSPYASFSSFAGNPLLINLDKLITAGDLGEADLATVPSFPVDTVDYGWVITWKTPLLEKAARNFLANGGSVRQADFKSFCTQNGSWLDDFALFMAVKQDFDQKAQKEGVDGAMWSNYWDTDIRLRQPKAVAQWQKDKEEAIAVQKVLQYYFFQQWQAVKRYANEHNIKIMGDIPIFVAPDSVDVWANREYFFLNKEGQPTVVAGVPPDYFSATGQLWGNPLYNWKAMAEKNFDWWLKRIRHTLKMVDVIRIDHFRGFEAYWEIPAGEKTAIKGKWVKAPGKQFFETVKKDLGNLPIVAEDLGLITKEVRALRDQFGFPGMRILQFAFDAKESGGINATNNFLPHNYEPNSIVYTGTHDNDTVLGWYQASTDEEKDFVRRYIARSDDNIVWEFLRLACSSVSRWAIFPMQDVLRLGSDARMNTPSVLGGNWGWRYRTEALNEAVSSMLSYLVDLYGRDPAIWKEKEEKDKKVSLI